jgi:hypothetical protein
MASALFWSINQTSQQTMEYWVRDAVILISKVGTVGLAILSLILLFSLKSTGAEAKRIPMTTVIIMALPSPFVIAGSLTTKEWWIAILAYLVYGGAIFGASIAGSRINTT